MFKIRSGIPGVNETMDKFSYLSDPIQRAILEGKLKDYPFKESEKEVYGYRIDETKLIDDANK